jgi:hypothetical protein
MLHGIKHVVRYKYRYKLPGIKRVGSTNKPPFNKSFMYNAPYNLLRNWGLSNFGHQQRTRVCMKKT